MRFFCPKLSSKFLERIGTLLIFPAAQGKLPWDLVDVDLLLDGGSTHVTCLEGLGTLLTGPVPTEENNVLLPLHANGTAVRVLDLRKLLLQILEPLGVGIGFADAVHVPTAPTR